MNIVDLSKRKIGEGYPTYIIAEMSANHSGSLNRALEIVHAAKESGADCIKIQTYTADTITINSKKQYFIIKGGPWDGENLYSLYQKAYTPWEWQGLIKEEAEKVGMDFLSTPFDNTSTDFLEEIGVEFYKIASFELVDIPLIKYVAAKGKPIVMSCGMGSIQEIHDAVDAIKSSGNNNIILLKCTSDYPAVYEDMNLKVIPDMINRFNVPVGLSDHSMGSLAAITAVSLGAKVIEKHFCIDRMIKNPDSEFSMEPNEFKSMVDDIRNTEKIMGQITYSLSEREKSNYKFRRSLFVIEDIKAGEKFSYKNVRSIRPSNGIAPKYLSDIVGKKASRNIEKGMPLEWDMVL